MLKYVAVDCETTGLDPANCQILEVALVAELGDWDIPVIELPKLHLFVEHKLYRGEARGFAMNSHLLDFLAEPGKWIGWTVVQEKNVAGMVADLLDEHFPGQRVTLAGKNVGAFDLAFLKQLPSWPGEMFRRRILDVGNLWLDPRTDDKLPELAECYRRAGYVNRDPHTALAGARTVVELVRRAYAQKGKVAA